MTAIVALLMATLLGWQADARRQGDPALKAGIVAASAVSLGEAVDIVERLSRRKAVHASIGVKVRPARYEVVVVGAGPPERMWVDPVTGTVTPGGRGDPEGGLPLDALLLGQLMAIVEQRIGGVATHAQGVTIEGRPGLQIDIVSDLGASQVYVDPMSAVLLSIVPHK